MPEPTETHMAIAWGIDSAAKVAGFTLGSPLTVPVGVIGLGAITAYQTAVYTAMMPGWVCQQVLLVWDALYPPKKKRDELRAEINRSSSINNITGAGFLVGILIGAAGIIAGSGELGIVGVALIIISLGIGLPESNKLEMLEKKLKRRKRNKR